MLSVNVAGLIYCAHAALPHLLRAAEDGPRGVADMINISSVAGRVARSGSGVYNLTKHGVGAFSESLRQEVTERHVRVSLVEPGAVATELASHNRPEIREQIGQRFGNVERLAGRGHRRRDPVHRHAPAARGGQRAADPADRAAGLADRVQATSLAELESGLAAGPRRTPCTVAPCELIVRRPAEDAARSCSRRRASIRIEGLVGDRWTPERSGPDTAVTLMSARAAALIAGPRARWALAGDQLYVDLDLSYANLPPGTLLSVGDAIDRGDRRAAHRLRQVPASFWRRRAAARQLIGRPRAEPARDQRQGRHRRDRPQRRPDRQAALEAAAAAPAPAASRCRYSPGRARRRRMWPSARASLGVRRRTRSSTCRRRRRRSVSARRRHAPREPPARAMNLTSPVAVASRVSVTVAVQVRRPTGSDRRRPARKRGGARGTGRAHEDVHDPLSAASRDDRAGRAGDDDRRPDRRARPTRRDDRPPWRRGRSAV